MNNRIKVYLSFLFILTLTARTFAGPISEDHPPVNAFSAGLGLTGVAISNNPATIFWNPSGLNRMEQLGFDFTIAVPTIESPGTWSFLLGNASEAQGTRFGLGMYRHHGKNAEHTFKSFATIWPFSHGFRAGKIPFGFSFKLISESIDDNKWKYGLSVDMGAMWMSPSGFRFGISTFNVGGSDLQTFETESWFGAYWDNNISPLSFSSQVRAERPFDSRYINQNFGVGINYRLTEMAVVGGRNLGATQIRSGMTKRNAKLWYTFGVDFVQAASDTHIGYAVVIDAKTWSGRSHYITYGYSYAAEKHKIPRGGTPFS